MKKRRLALFLTFVMIISMFPVNVFGTQFLDMPSNWSTEALEKSVLNGLLIGNNGKIMPNESLTRAQLATIVNRAFGTIEKSSIIEFTDVEKGEWYYDEMAKAVQMKTFTGNDGRLNPNSNITREEAFVVLSRAFKMSESKSDVLNKFSDKDFISDWARESVSSLVTAGYISGSNGNINPKQNITRAELAQIMDNLIKEYISAEGTYTKNYIGNLMVNVPNVVLKNATVTGDLIIGDGVGNGEVILDGVTVAGRTIIRGGGENSIKITGNSVVKNIIIARVNGKLKIYAEDGTEIDNVIIDGNDDVIIEGNIGSVNVIADGITITVKNANIVSASIEGNNSKITIDRNSKINTVSMNSQNANIEVSGQITNIEIASNAKNAKINVLSNAKVENVVVNSRGARIEGSGSVKTVMANSNDVVVTTSNTLVTAAIGTSGVMAGNKMVASGKTENTTKVVAIKSGNGSSNTAKDMTLENIVSTFKNNIDGEDAFNNVSYVYLGWRTTGGPWQNHVIKNFIVNKLVDSGFDYSDVDMSTNIDDDYVWVQKDDSADLVWAPQFASLEVVSEADEELVKSFNIVAYGFDPTCKIYKKHYGEEYGIETIDDMYEWITEKDNEGNRTNVLNRKEAELNKRTHLATNSGFTDPIDTDLENAKGVQGEVVYIGKVANKKVNGVTVYYGTETKIEGNDSLKGKVLLSDTSNSNTFKLAQQVEAVSIMTTAALSNYNNPTIDGEVWYKDSARYASGTNASSSLTQMKAGKPIVIWNLSLNQKEAMYEMLKKGQPVIVKAVSIGGIYSMGIDKGEGGEGQLTAIAEIKGTTKADERVLFMAHVQEPSACDNASGVGAQLELVMKLKKMIDSGEIKRPERTMTFFWGDEMKCSTLWLNAHSNLKSKVVGTIDLDMVGENPEKTGGVMRIEKTPDPSAIYNYTLDVLPGEDPYTDEEQFVRLPDSHTLWGAGDVPDIGGLYLNDLYMAATQEVIKSVDPTFKVAVCPYEGGSDHTVFLNAGIPSVLTWHFTDYVYHTTVDTLDKVSSKELENVGITSIAAGYMAAIAEEYESEELMKIMHDAAVKRFEAEALNTANLFEWTKNKGKSIEEALELETEILEAWGTWYKEAIESCQYYFVGNGASSEFLTLKADYLEKVNIMTQKAVSFANQKYQATLESYRLDIMVEALNFNTHKSTDYNGVIVDFRLKGTDLNSIDSVKVELYDALNNKLVENKFISAFAFEEKAYSTKFVISTGTYNPDSSQEFGSWSPTTGTAIPAKAVITVMDINGLPYTAENTSFQAIEPVYPNWESLFEIETPDLTPII